jgi:hypothetical protein
MDTGQSFRFSCLQETAFHTFMEQGGFHKAASPTDQTNGSPVWDQTAGFFCANKLNRHGQD